MKAPFWNDCLKFVNNIAQALVCLGKLVLNFRNPKNVDSLEYNFDP